MEKSTKRGKKRKIIGVEDVPDEEEQVEFITVNNIWKETLSFGEDNAKSNVVFNAQLPPDQHDMVSTISDEQGDFQGHKKGRAMALSV